MKYSTHDIASFLRLYAVTGHGMGGSLPLENQVEAAIKGGCTCIQLRQKNLSTAEYIKIAERIHVVTQKYHVPLIINDSVETAAASGAEGVHLGAHDMNAAKARKILGKDSIIGVSAHNPAEAQQAAVDGADYIGIGAVFPTSTKTDAHVLPHEMIIATSSAAGIPSVAIGGITADNIEYLKDCGISGIAVVSAVFNSGNIIQAAQNLRKKADKLFGQSDTFTQKNIAKPPAVVTIAGSDCCGGAGIQADIKTFEACGVYGMSVITSIVAENTCGLLRRNGSEGSAIFDIPPEHITAQLDAACSDIVPSAIKIGMIHSPKAADAVGRFLAGHAAGIPIITDPVIAAKDGSRLMSIQSETVIKERIFPVSFMLTPNIPEAELLSGIMINSKKTRMAAAQEICRRYGCVTVLIKGGHEKDSTESVDYVFDSRNNTWFTVSAPRIHTTNTHGTGCTYSSAIAAYLAKGHTVRDAVHHAKTYITGAIEYSLSLGHGAGPLNHQWQHIQQER